MAKRWRVADGTVAIWEGANDTLPFTDPANHADRVLFTTKFNYTRIIDKRTVNVAFPAVTQGAERRGTITLFAHGVSGYPRVRGNITIAGHKLSLGSHVPVQYYGNGKGGFPQIFRLAIIGATTTHVVICWYINFLAVGKSSLPAVTFPVTVEVTNEINA